MKRKGPTELNIGRLCIHACWVVIGIDLEETIVSRGPIHPLEIPPTVNRKVFQLLNSPLSSNNQSQGHNISILDKFLRTRVGLLLNNDHGSLRLILNDGKACAVGNTRYGGTRDSFLQVNRVSRS